jgi:hypothetical protein
VKVPFATMVAAVISVLGSFSLVKSSQDVPAAHADPVNAASRAIANIIFTVLSL